MKMMMNLRQFLQKLLQMKFYLLLALFSLTILLTKGAVVAQEEDEDDDEPEASVDMDMDKLMDTVKLVDEMMTKFTKAYKTATTEISKQKTLKEKYCKGEKY